MVRSAELPPAIRRSLPCSEPLEGSAIGGHIEIRNQGHRGRESGGWNDGHITLSLDELPDGVLVATLDGFVAAANSAFLNLIGRNSETVLGARFESLLAEEDVLHLVGFQTLFGERNTQDNNLSFVTPQGERRALVVSGVRSRDERHIVMTARTAGVIHEAMADASRWAAAEQDRSREILLARDALAAKNEALLTAQAALQEAYATLQRETEVRKRLETELSLAQRLESIGQLAAGVAHEINTPMQYVGDNVTFLAAAFGGLSGYIDQANGVLDRAGPDPHEARGLLLAAQKQVRLSFLLDEAPRAIQASRDGIAHVSKIIQALKAFAHRDTDEKVVGDINRTLRDTLTVAQNEYRQVANIETALDELPPIYCFPGKLNQVFLNLIINAAHAIQDANKSALGLIRVASSVEDGHIVVSISDDGCGIPAAIEDRIFEQFFTTKQVGRGSGQGLSLARRIVVDLHGGTLSFESTVGQGTTFLIRLPVSTEAAPAPQ
jgi:PAS domain S-box-containing protein